MPMKMALGRQPLTFMTPSGQQRYVPLSHLYFDETNTLRGDRWPHYNDFKDILDKRLSVLSASKEIVSGPEIPPPAEKPAADTGQAEKPVDPVSASVAPVSPVPPTDGDAVSSTTADSTADAVADSATVQPPQKSSTSKK